MPARWSLDVGSDEDWWEDWTVGQSCRALDTPEAWTLAAEPEHRHPDSTLGKGRERGPGSEPSALLMSAARKNKAGETDEAIKLTERACRIIQEDPEWRRVVTEDDGLQPFLRLAIYYQLAGQSDNAWRLLEWLSREVARWAATEPNELEVGRHANGAWCEIEDRMRYHLHREGKAVEAVRHGVFSYLYMAKSLWYGVRCEEFSGVADFIQLYERRISEEDTREDVGFHLREAMRLDVLDDLVEAVRAELANLPEIDFARVDAKIRELLLSGSGGPVGGQA